MRFNAILAGVDGSPESAAAAALAHRLAEATGASLQLVHAVPEFNVPAALLDVATGRRMPAQHRRAQAQRSMRAGLRGLVPDAAIDGLQVESGKAPVVLREAARRYQADLVVVGAKRRSAMGRGLSGSVVPHLVRTLDVPVLLADLSARLPKRVLIAVDLSPVSDVVLRDAMELVAALGADARAFYAAEVATFALAEPSLTDPRGSLDRGREALDWLADAISPILDRAARAGEPAEAIAAEARAWPADLIVVGSHGKDWVDRLLIGSTTERLAAELPASMLVLPMASVLAAQAAGDVESPAWV